MCTVLLPPGDNPIAVNKYIISYHENTKNINLPVLYVNEFLCAPLITDAGNDPQMSRVKSKTVGIHISKAYGGSKI
jgi:hypothetical protein